MSVARTNVEFAKRIFSDRVGNDYVYGGNWNPFNLKTGTDCSGLVVDICDAVRNGTAMAWTRHGMSTETWRPIEVGATGTIFNTVCVNHPNDFPADAAVKIALHHGPGGGANSHMWCEVEGIRMESNGSDGCVTGDRARSVYDTSYANDWHYLPGPIVQDAGGPALSTKDRYAMATIEEGRRLNITPKGICIGLSVELVETNLTMYANSNVPASLSYPHEKVGSDHDSTGLFQQRQAWGPLSSTMDPAASARLFFLGGQAGQRGLTAFDYNSDSRTPGGWAQAVQVSQFPDRYDERYAEAEQIYNRLIALGDDELSAEAERKISELHAALLSKKESRSIYATPGEGARWPWYELPQNEDGRGHQDDVETQARAGNHDDIARVALVAAGQGKVRDQWAIDRAKRVLAQIEAANPQILQQYLAQKGRA